LRIFDKIKNSENNSTNSETTNINHSIDNQTNQSQLEELSELLGGGHRIRFTGNVSSTIRHKILCFTVNEPRISLADDFSIINYWKNKRDDSKFNDLFSLATVVYGGAFSQVKCERDFSGLMLIYNHLRTRLSPETLNDTMIVKFNLDLLDKVNFI